MQALLTHIELDIQELKYLMKAFECEPDETLRKVLKRDVLQMRGRLDQILIELDTVQPSVEEDVVESVVTDQKAVEPILGDRIRQVIDLRKSISLNDSFRFSRELFDGDVEQMNRVIEQISEMSSLDAAIAFLLSKVDVDEETEVLVDFQELLKKHFN